LADSNLTVHAGLFEAALGRMSAEQFAKFDKDIANFGEDTRILDPFSGQMVETNQLKAAMGGSASQLEEYLRLQGAGGINLKATTESDQEALNKIATNSEQFSEAAHLVSTQIGALLTQPLQVDMPDWWAKGLKVEEVDGQTRLVPGDTSTPRAGGIGDTATSKLSQTMGRHAAMDGQLTGKRTVTSSLRNYALGSPSSDHATGSAYDLTGQNLGMYARLVHSNGAVAEFHASAANRHLHVVPGPGVGDTRTAKSVSAGSSTSASSSSSL
jgi:hypothetical protein